MEGERLVEIQPEQILLLTRARRHTLTNHLQILSGWLQMGQTDRALEHLERLRDVLAGESELVRVLSPKEAARWLLIQAEGEVLGVELLYRCETDGPFQWPDRAVAEFAAAVVQGMIGNLAGDFDGHRVVVRFMSLSDRLRFRLELPFACPAAAARKALSRLDLEAGFQHVRHLGGSWSWQDAAGERGCRLEIDLPRIDSESGPQAG